MQRYLISLLFLGLQTAFALNNHPRIWLDTATKANLAFKVAQGDSDWTTTLAYANQALSYKAQALAITSATNSNPVQFTIAGTMPFRTGVPMYFGGATGAVCANLNSWTCLNSPTAWSGHPAYAWSGVISVTGANTFTIPLDSTNFGSFAGQSVAVFSPYAAAGFFEYDYEASSWYQRVVPLIMAYQGTGNVAYARKAIEWLDYYNGLSAAGIDAPISMDAGYPTRYVPVLLGLVYDWCYGQLDWDGQGAARKAATAQSAQLIMTYLKSDKPYEALPVNPDSNYAAGHLMAGAVLGYALLGDDPNAQANIDWAATNYNVMFSQAFSQPTMPPTGYGGSWLGAVPAGTHYDTNWTIPYYVLYNLTRSSAGDTSYMSQGYMQKFAATVLYDVKPDNWRYRMDGIQTGSTNGIFNPFYAKLLNHLFKQYGNAGADATLSAYLQNLLGHLGGPLLNTTGGDQISYFYDTLFRWPNQATSPSGLPGAYFAGGIYPRLYWRSDWTTAADWMMFYPAARSVNAASGPTSGDTRVAGEIDINRGTDYLIVNSQNWFGSTDGTSGASRYGGIYAANDLASTLFFYDGGNQNCQVSNMSDGGTSGGGAYPGDPAYKSDPSGTWLYAMGDITEAYVGPCAAQNRTLRYWYRSVAAVGNGTYVVADRILAKQPGFNSHIRWQFSSLGTPTQSGPTISNVVGASKIYVNTVLPVSPAITLVSNAPAYNGTPTYRAEVRDSAGGAGQNILTVLSATAKTSAQPPITNLSSLGIDSNHQGVQIADTVPKVVVFGWNVTDNGNDTYTSNKYNGATFTTNHSGTGNYLVDGLQQGTYTVTRNGSAVAGIQPVGPDGVLSFASASGSFSIVQASGVSTAACDLNGDGAINVVDVQLAVNVLLGTRACPAAFVTGPGICSVTMNKIVTAALGGACIAP